MIPNRNEDAALVEQLSKLSRRSSSHEGTVDNEQESRQDYDLFLLPTIRPSHKRVRRQDSGAVGEGLSNMLSGVGGRLTSFRESWRETVRPIQQNLNPMPHIENFGKMIAEASTTSVNRGREAFRGVRDFGSRSMGRIREGVTDAWENVRDGWEELFDL